MGSVRDQLPPGDVVIITALVAAGVKGLCSWRDKSSAPSGAVEMKTQLLRVFTDLREMMDHQLIFENRLQIYSMLFFSKKAE